MSENDVVEIFVVRTGEAREIAQKYLEENYWGLSTALTFYQADMNEGKI
ncbi:hypothetical protein [Enterobacter cancerogenus]|jgi:hypothetical protein|nr:hypothetical protein [Enterobacter cancerogenus]